MYNEERAYGFMTAKKVSLLKAYPEDISTMMRLFSIETGKYSREEKDQMRWNWINELTQEVDDTENVTFIIRDKCNKPIGLVSSETEDGINYSYYIWFQNGSKRVQFQEYICECLLEFVEDHTDIKKVEGIYAQESSQTEKALILRSNIVFDRKKQQCFF